MNPRVLIVDDDPAVREIVAAILQREGIDSDVASDGEQAIRLLSSGSSYAAVVLDLLMPRIDGAGVMAFIRDHGIAAPVIVMSAVSGDAVLDPTIVRVAMQKPIQLADLRDVVRAVVRSAAP
jgi:DNA-binding response OmpR family regulator